MKHYKENKLNPETAERMSKNLKDFNEKTTVSVKDAMEAMSNLGKKVEVPNMRVMISLPMNGRKDDEVRERIKKLKEKFAKLHIDVVDSFLTDEIKNSYHPGVYYLGRTLTQFMHNVDAVYFDEGWEKARGCRIERSVCEEYDIKILDKSFFIPQVSVTTISTDSIPEIEIKRKFIPELQIEKNNKMIFDKEENHIPNLY